ncbi:alpha/beta hydrolase family protein [Kitasatospora sp. NPDC051853]|uniref:alpha/beta hydrolase family protein n=1 Tax=Kitasatospora sp. NPDC051853 TaxID=3364058 RepID=UPI00379D9B05
MTTTTTTTAPAPTGPGTARPVMRTSVRFAPDGRGAAGLAGTADGRKWAELWSFDGEVTHCQPLPAAEGETLRTQPVPTPDGRVLVLRLGPDGHRTALLEPDGTAVLERPLGTVRTRGARLLPSADPEVLGLLFTVTDTTRSVWRIEARPGPGFTEVLRTAAEFGGGVWLDRAGRRLSVSLRQDGRIVPGILDLTAGTLAADETLPAGQVRLAAETSGLLVLAGGPPNAPVHTLVGPGREPRTLSGWTGLPGTAHPLAFDPDGRRIALHVETGARSQLWLHDLGHDTLTRLPVPDGVLRGPAHWGTAGLRFPYSTPVLPTGMALAVPDGGWAFTGSLPQGAGAHTEWLAGAEGAMEAVVHGGPAWWRSPRLVVALHGGPQAHWDLGHEPFLQRLAAAGCAVVAPNQRGSTGYGDAHRDVLDGAWGVPDLADLLHLAEQLARRRRPLGLEPPALYGSSYGAHLALLAAVLRPGLWSRCLAVAPFLSGRRLHRVASAPTRALLDRLGAVREAGDAVGPRDLVRLFAAAPPGAPPLFVVHGRQDEVIPVGQSRELRRTLLGAGWAEGRDLWFHELPTGGHAPLDDGTTGNATAAAAARFLTGAGH